MRGKFIVLEGIDGCGKTTQFEKIRLYLEMKFSPKDIAFSKDLGGSVLGEELRRIMYTVIPPKDMAPGVLDLLFLAGHVQNWKARVEPWLKEGRVVVSDRWWLSQFTYGPHRGWHEGVAELYYKMKGAWPDLTIFLYGDPTALLARANARTDSPVHQEQKAWNDVETQRKVADDYFMMFSNEPGWTPICVDGKNEEEVWLEVRAAVDRLLED